MLLCFSGVSFAKVENCQRRAQILKGIVQHHWIKTDTKSAGMGSGLSDEQIGDTFEAPYTTHVFVIDHSNQSAEKCEEIKEIDEDCVNAELDVGKSLGRFSLVNNCQFFVFDVLKKCSTKLSNSNVYGERH